MVVHPRSQTPSVERNEVPIGSRNHDSYRTHLRRNIPHHGEYAEPVRVVAPVTRRPPYTARTAGTR